MDAKFIVIARERETRAVLSKTLVAHLPGAKRMETFYKNFYAHLDGVDVKTKPYIKAYETIINGKRTRVTIPED